MINSKEDRRELRGKIERKDRKRENDLNKKWKGKKKG